MNYIITHDNYNAIATKFDAEKLDHCDPLFRNLFFSILGEILSGQNNSLSINVMTDDSSIRLNTVSDQNKPYIDFLKLNSYIQNNSLENLQKLYKDAMTSSQDDIQLLMLAKNIKKLSGTIQFIGKTITIEIPMQH